MIIVALDREHVSIKCSPGGERFPRMPNDSAFLRDFAREEDAEEVRERIGSHAPFDQSVGNVTITAIKIAEGGWLHNDATNAHHHPPLSNSASQATAPSLKPMCLSDL